MKIKVVIKIRRMKKKRRKVKGAAEDGEKIFQTDLKNFCLLQDDP